MPTCCIWANESTRVAGRTPCPAETGTRVSAYITVTASNNWLLEPVKKESRATLMGDGDGAEEKVALGLTDDGLAVRPWGYDHKLSHAVPAHTHTHTHTLSHTLSHTHTDRKSTRLNSSH